MRSHQKSKFHLSLLIIASVILLTLPEILYAQYKASGNIFLVLRGILKSPEGKPCEGVELKIRENNVLSAVLTTPKNGKYSIRIEVDTVYPNIEYQLSISKPGFIPKRISINPYIKKKEFENNLFERYNYDLEIEMIEAHAKDVIIEKPSGKIQWDYQQHSFGFYQTAAKITQRKDELTIDSTDIHNELTIHRTYIADSVRNTELAKQKSEAKAESIATKKLSNTNQAVSISKTDSSQIITTQTVENKPIVSDSPPTIEQVDQSAFQGNETYSLNTAKQSLKTLQDKIIKKKNINLSTKYETNNILTSLLNSVDSYDKKNRK